jgi:MFS family permease
MTAGRRWRSRDIATLFAMRIVRMAAYVGLAIVLALYLVEIGLDEGQVGLLLVLTLGGDAIVSLVLSTRADRFGRRPTLVIGAGLMILGGAVFVSTGEFIVLVAAAIIAVLSPRGNEVGPFLAVEQAALSWGPEDRLRPHAVATFSGAARARRAGLA